MTNLKLVDNLENELIEKYKSEVRKIVSKMSDAAFKRMLLQRRWTSYAFTPLYDYGIDGIRNEGAKTVLREIRNEEYPPGPSHREDLVHDLKIVGIEIEDIMNTMPSKQTMKCISSQIKFLRLTEEQTMHDIKVVAFLRFALEVLVSAEYGIFAERIEDFGLTRRNSKFYWPHFLHDMKQQPLGAAGNTHSDAMSKCLGEMLDNIKKVQLCSKTAHKAYDMRMEFFKQTF